jgi:hypothetical protein
MPNRASDFDQQASRPGRSRYERLRLHGAVRSAIIAFGIGAVTFVAPLPKSSAGSSTPGPAAGALTMLRVGIGFQLLVLLVRKLTAGRDTGEGGEGNPAPFAMFVIELLADGLTVLLFAIATFRGIAQYGIGTCAQARRLRRAQDACRAGPRPRHPAKEG